MLLRLALCALVVVGGNAQWSYNNQQQAPAASQGYNQQVQAPAVPQGYNQQAQAPAAQGYGQQQQAAAPAPSSYAQQAPAAAPAAPASYGQQQQAAAPAPSSYVQQAPAAAPAAPAAYGQQQQAAAPAVQQGYGSAPAQQAQAPASQSYGSAPAQQAQAPASQGYGSAPAQRAQAPASRGYGSAPAQQPQAPASQGYGSAPAQQPQAPASRGYGSAPAQQPQAPASRGYGNAPASRPQAPAPSSGGYGSAPSSQPQAPGGYAGSSAPSIRPQSPGSPSGGYGSVSAPSIRPSAPGANAPAIRPSAPGGYGSGSGSGVAHAAPAQSEGSCDFDASKWSQHAQCAIAKAVMYQRTTGLTCEECLASCVESQTNPWACKSVSYDHRWLICDLFAVDGTQAPAFLVSFPGRDIFVMNGNAAPTTDSGDGDDGSDNTDGGDAEDSCGADSSSSWTLLEGAVLEMGEQDADATTLDDCQAACASSDCASFDFLDGQCTLSTKANDFNNNMLLAVDDGVYGERVCLPKDLAGGDNTQWKGVYNHILIGHVKEVVDAGSLAECEQACLESADNFDFECQSIMWYPEDDGANCLLNTETRVTRADVFQPEEEGIVMIYADVPSAAKRQRRRNSRLQDQPIDTIKDDKYTSWSRCSKSETGISYRFEKCSSNDVRKCAKQTKKCGATSVVSIGAPCMAVVDRRGRKRCPFGVRVMSDGKRHFCDTPLDC